MEIVKALVEIQKTLKAPKGQYNSFGKYKYRSSEDILEAVKPLNAAQTYYNNIRWPSNSLSKAIISLKLPRRQEERKNQLLSERLRTCEKILYCIRTAFV